MTQVTSTTGGQTRQLMVAKDTAISCPATGNTTLLEVPTAGLDNLAVQIDVTVQALDAFIIQGRFHPDGAFVTIYSAAGDYTAPVGLLVAASGDLTAQAAGTTGWFILDVRALYAVKVLASGAVNNALVSVYASGASN